VITLEEAGSDAEQEEDEEEEEEGQGASKKRKANAKVEKKTTKKVSLVVCIIVSDPVRLY
jgi:hypothetical protein